MRAAALIAALACAATAAHAQDAARESRYGPAPDRAPTPVNGQGPRFTATPYGGAMLGWSGKREAVDPAATPQAAQQPWWTRQAPSAPQAPVASQAPVAPTPRYAPQPPPAPVAPQANAAPTRALPQSLYDIHPEPVSAPQVAPAYAPPAPPQQQAALQPGQITARTYSVGRQFGMQPDPIPAAGPTRMVLIAPPASAPKDEAEDAPRDDRDWPAKTDKDGAQ